MQPSSEVKFDEKSFNIIKKSIKNISDAKKGKLKDKAYATHLPRILGLKLTNKCNLRCEHCYEWNEDGYHRNLEQSKQNAEMNIDIIEKVLKETHEVASSLYLWGGEPLYYRYFDDLAKLIEKDNRITAICTNGTLLEEKIDSILRFGSNLELLVAIDGFEEDNDSIRGKGTFSKAINSIKYLIELRKKNVFRGKISIHTVISEKMLNKIFDFICYLENIGVDSVYMCFPWYISDETSNQMTKYYNKHFEILSNKTNNQNYSWNAFKYQLDPIHTDTVVKEMKKVKQKTWKLRVKFQPDLEYCQVKHFLAGENICKDENRKCMSISTRMDILPDGLVTSCKHFPELSIGNLEKLSVFELWHCEKFKMVREVIDKQLMPVCSKCNNLYLHSNLDYIIKSIKGV